MARIEPNSTEVKSVSFDSSGQYLAICTRNHQVMIWDAMSDDYFDTCTANLDGHTQDVKRVLFHPNREMLVSASYDDTIRIWRDEGDDYECAQTLRSHTSTVWDVAFNDEGDRIVSCSDDKSVIVWEPIDKVELDGWQVACTAQGVSDFPLYSVDWQKGKIIVSGGDDCIRIFEVQTRPAEDGGGIRLEKVDEKDSAHAGDVNCVRFSPVDTGVFCSVGDDKVVRLWSV
uniref:Cytosolic iron-sulfur protein assembly protein CIAO1 homolog n=2 Tax=Palpitomonas bilix TaxID=652834 RepID=A0A7S3CVI5_9EUKA|mmetsp:Transcript_10670/g.27931  ORF Transcript_10670/g.27931 Transcript_10670/m.27931 type:complete len:229 (+) Transcript_10670:165-851(+)